MANVEKNWPFWKDAFWKLGNVPSFYAAKAETTKEIREYIAYSTTVNGVRRDLAFFSATFEKRYYEQQSAA